MMQSPLDRIDQDKQRRMMKEAQVMPTMRPASHKTEKRSSATAAEKRGISALTVQRRMIYQETNGLFAELNYICRQSKVSRMKTVHLNKMITRRLNRVVYKINLMNKKRKATEHMKDCIILDNGLTMSLFANLNLVEKIRESKNTLELHTNTGCKRNKMEADVPGFGTVWFNPDSQT